jgi:DNA-binding transcriptional ArsR family regulator
MARPARTADTPRPARALVRDMTPAPASAAPQPEIVLEARSAVDFVVSLMLDTESELLAADRAWFDASKASMSDHLRHDVVRVFGADHEHSGIGGGLISSVMEDPSIRSAADVVALAARLSIGDLLENVCSDADAMTALPATRAVLEGDPAHRDEAVAAWPPALRGVMGRVLDDPEGEMRALRRVLRAWAERFAAIETRVASMEQRDVDSRRAEFGRLAPADFVERCTGGVRWMPEPGTRRLILSPSYFARPYNYVFGGRDWHMFAYPLAESALGVDPDAVPAASVRLFKALGDESRMRILRLLSSGDLYLTEIAERMSLSKPTVSHHLAQLRAAGLVTITQAGSLTYYTLRRDRLTEAREELVAYLGESSR